MRIEHPRWKCAGRLASLLWLVTALSRPLAGAESHAGAVPAEAYRLGAGDVITLIVEGQAELTGSYTIGRDGTVLVPLIERVEAAGRTPAELEKEITERLAKDYLVDPKVSVAVREYNSRQVYLMIGDGPVVSRPIGPKGTLSELLLDSGLPAKMFSAGEAIILRRESETSGAPRKAEVAAKVNLPALMLKGDLSQDVRLHRGDVVRIPSPETNFVYLLVGDAPAATVPLGEKGTLSELLLEAKLPAGAFSSGVATVTRTEHDASGAPRAKEVARVDLNKLMVQHDLSLDCALRHGDIVRIPPATRRSVYLVVGDAPPVAVPLGERPSLKELLLRAGVPTRMLSFGKATVTRNVAEKAGERPKAKVVAEVDLKKLMLDQVTEEDCVLSDGDIVRIPPPESRAVHLMVGEAPVQSVEIEPETTLSKLLVEAKVPAGLFAVGRATVSRLNPEGKAEQIAEVDLAELMLEHDAKADLVLKPGDIIRIPEAATKFVYILVERPQASRSAAGRLSATRRGRGGTSYPELQRLFARVRRANEGEATSLPTTRPHIEKIKHPLGEMRMLSQVLLDANLEPELFETSAVVVSRIDSDKDSRRGIPTSAIIDPYEIILNLNRSRDVELRPNDIIYVVPRRKVADRGYVYVLGGVKRPGPYRCRPRLDAREAVAEAGGYLDGAAGRGLVVVRRAARLGVARLSAAAVKTSQPHAAEFLIETGDTVYVPERLTPRPTKAIWVLGHVGKPGRIDHHEGLTLRAALERAGGPGSIGSLGKIVLMHKSEGVVKPSAWLLNYKLEDQDAKERTLEPGDVVIVHP